MMTIEAINTSIPLPGITIKRIAFPDSLEISLPVHEEMKTPAPETIMTQDLPIPLHKWVMPSEPQGYIRQKENDCL